MTDWQPIETARGYTEVLVYDPTNAPSVFTAPRMDSDWECSVENRYAPMDDYFGDTPKNPTHWMPLPEPPDSGEPV